MFDKSDMLVLRSGNLTVELAPHIGGAIASFFQMADTRRFDWLRPASGSAISEKNPLDMASFPLLPFCNRIRHGEFNFQGEAVKLPANLRGEPHAIHGMGWQRPWQVVQRDHSSALLQLDYPAASWPWAFSASQLFELSPDGLRLSLRLQNRSKRPMPFGFGHHPYFLKSPGMSVQLHSQLMWQTDSEVLPTALTHTPIVSALSRGIPLEKISLDHHFVGWDRSAVLRFQQSVDSADSSAAEFPNTLVLTAEPPLNFIALYVPEKAPYFCLEPVSNCTDWLDSPVASKAHFGGDFLLPDESRKALITLRTTSL